MGLLPSYSIKDKSWLIVKRRWTPALIILIIISFLGIIITYNIKPVYTAKTKLKFKNINYNALLKNISSEETKLFTLKDQASFVSTEVEVLRSIPLLQKTISELQLTNNQGQLITIEQFRKQLNVQKIDPTDIVEISYQDSNTKTAMQVVNTLIANYLDRDILISRIELDANKDFLNNQLEKIEATLEQAEESIVKIKEEQQIITPQGSAINLSQTLEEVSRQIIANRSEIAKLKSQSQYIANKLGMNSDKALISVAVNQSLIVQNLTQQIQELELQLIKQRSNELEEDFIISKIQREIKAKQELLEKQITKIAGDQEIILFKNSDLDIIQELTLELIKLEANNIGLTQKLEYLVQIEQDKSQKASLIPQFESQVRQLERKLNTSQNAYNLIREKLNNLELSATRNARNLRVISSEVISNRPTHFYYLSYLASLFLGLMVAVGVIYFLEISDRSLKTIEEAKNFLGYSWLGIIPRISAKSRRFVIKNRKKKKIPQLFVQAEPFSNIHESYRVLYSNLKFICSQSHIKTIVVTSSLAEEGKSSIAANLAYTMAQRGDTVLLIDANLHSPIQDKIWDIRYDLGISDLLTEQLSPQSVIQRVIPNLDAIFSGEIDSSASILDSPKMQSLIDNYSIIYDFIIIDSPALDITADAISLGSIADGILFIVQSSQINRFQANFAKELLEKSGQNILGFVLNKFNSTVKAYSSQLTNDLIINNQEKFSNLKQPKASLWEMIAHDPRALKNNRFIFNLDSEELNAVSLEELEKNFNYLEQELEKLTQMVREQEDEFFLQGQTVRKLQKQVNLANTRERSRLEQKLLQAQEVKHLLGETLLGQRRNLNQKKEILVQYKNLLSSKKNTEAQFNGHDN